FIAVDPLLPVSPETRGASGELHVDMDAFSPSDDEWRLPEPAGEPAAVLGSLAGGRLRFVARKRGAAGGWMYDARERRLHAWPARAPRVEDPTGAGDAFVAGFVTAHLAGPGVGP